MKKMNLMFALAAVAAGVSLNAEEVNKKEVVVTATASVTSKLSAEEQAFAGKLTEENRKAFEQFTADQRKAVMAAACEQGTCNKTAVAPNDAVQKAIKDHSAVVADKAAAAAAAAATKAPAQVK